MPVGFPSDDLPASGNILNKEKARRAALDDGPPGEKCGAAPGAFRPVVDRNACEGKRDCVEVCPYGVFEVRRISDEHFARLTFFGKIKSRAHARQTAYTPNADQCRACGLCVTSCPERAISLVSS